MKKADMDRNQKIDEFLKCKDGSESFQLDEQKLAKQILFDGTSKTVSFPLIRYWLPVAACVAIFLGFLVQKSDFIPNRSSGSEMVQATAASSSNLYLLPEEITMLDEWLLASPESVDFFSVDFDSSYELLVSLETIPLP